MVWHCLSIWASIPKGLFNSQVFHHLTSLFLHLLYNMMLHLFNEIIHYHLITLIHHRSQLRTSDLLKNLHRFKNLYCLTLQYFNLYNPFQDCLMLSQTKFLNNVVDYSVLILWVYIVVKLYIYVNHLSISWPSKA